MLAVVRDFVARIELSKELLVLCKTFVSFWVYSLEFDYELPGFRIKSATELTSVSGELLLALFLYMVSRLIVFLLANEALPLDPSRTASAAILVSRSP